MWGTSPVAAPPATFAGGGVRQHLLGVVGLPVGDCVDRGVVDVVVHRGGAVGIVGRGGGSGGRVVVGGGNGRGGGNAAHVGILPAGGDISRVAAGFGRAVADVEADLGGVGVQLQVGVDVAVTAGGPAQVHAGLRAAGPGMRQTDRSSGIRVQHCGLATRFADRRPHSPAE